MLQYQQYAPVFPPTRAVSTPPPQFTLTSPLAPDSLLCGLVILFLYLASLFATRYVRQHTTPLPPPPPISPEDQIVRRRSLREKLILNWKEEIGQLTQGKPLSRLSKEKQEQVRLIQEHYAEKLKELCE